MHKTTSNSLGVATITTPAFFFALFPICMLLLQCSLFYRFFSFLASVDILLVTAYSFSLMLMVQK